MSANISEHKTAPSKANISSPYIVNSTCAEDILGLSRPDALWPFDVDGLDGVSDHDPLTSSKPSFDSVDKIAGAGSAVFNGVDNFILYAGRNGDKQFMRKAFDKLSVGFWMKPATPLKSGSQVLFYEGGPTDGVMIILSDKGNIEVNIMGSSTLESVEPIPFPNDGEWHHIAFTYTEGELLVVYLDGIVKGMLRTNIKIQEHHGELELGQMGGFGKIVSADNILSIPPGASTYEGKIDEAFYTYKGIQGGDLLRYVQCLSGKSFSSRALRTADAFQIASSKWFQINFAEEITAELPVPDEDSDPLLDGALFVNAAGINAENNIIYSIRRGDQSDFFPRIDFNFMVITELRDATLVSDYEYVNNVVGPIKGLPNELNYISGDVYDNRLYVKPTLSTDIIYVIDIDVNSPGFLTVERTIQLEKRISVSDFVIDINTGLLYTSSDTKDLLEINLGTGKITTLATLTYPDGPGSGRPIFGAQFMDSNGFFYGINNNDGIIYRVDLNSTNPDAVYFLQSTQTSNNDGVGNNIDILLDFGDAPDSYGTSLENSGARHFVDFDTDSNLPFVMLGSTVDEESNAFSGQGIGDDNDNEDDEDGFFEDSLSFDVSAGNLRTPEISYTNSTINLVNIYAWIDFNKNGRFDNEESISVFAPPSGNLTTSVVLEWASLPSDLLLDGNPTYMRVRITTDDLEDSDPNDGIDDRSIGAASDGEVEDYQVLLTCVSPAPAFTQVDPTCTVATGSVSVTNPQGTSTYTLTGTSPAVAPQTGTSFTGLAPGTYELTETTSAGCSSSASVITITPQPVTPPAPAFTQVDPTCDVATGSVSVTNPQATSTYTLTGTSPAVAPQTGTGFTGLAPGTYELTETTSAGCSSSASVITVAPQPLTPPAPGFAQVDPTCTVATGSVSVTAPQATSTYTLTGTSPAVAPQTGTGFTGLAPGTYELTETTSAGCSSSASVITIAPQPLTPPAPGFAQVDPTCDVATGSVSVTNPQGTSTYTLTGTSPAVAPQTGTSFTGLAPGTYELTETTSAGCSSSASVITVAPQPLTPPAPGFAQVDPTCTVATGSVSVTAPQGTSTYTLTGTSPVVAPQTGTSFTGLAPGTYELTETTSAGCSSSASVITIAPQPLTPPAPAFAQVDPTCTVATGSVSVTAPQGTSTYTLTGTSPAVAPQTGTSFTGLAPGTYELTETTSAGCSSSASVITIAPQPLTPPAPAFAQVDPTCTVATGSVSVTSPQGTSTYTLTGTSPAVAPQTGTSFTGLAPGTYELTETTSAGCSSSASVITIAPQPLTPPAPGFAQVDPTCTVATGSVSVTAPQGTSTYTLTGTSPVVAPQTGTSFTGLAPGTYELTETTSAGCSSSASVITVAPQPLTPPAPGFAQVDPTCTVATGSVSVTAPQGTSTYTLTGTSPVVAPQTGTSFTGLAPGTYELTETTSAGCSSSASVITVAPQPLTPPAPGFAQVDPTCTVATGSVSVTSPQGTSTYTLTGTSPVVAPQTGTSFTGLAPGTYELTETTSAGCSSSASVITVAPQPLTPPAPAFAQVDPTCTVATGSVSVTVPQGTSTYTLTGTSPAVAPQTGTSFTGLAPGTYELTETTSAGCSSSASVITVAPQPLTPPAPGFAQVDPTCTVATGSVSVTAPQGTSTYTLTGTSPVVAPQTGTSFTGLAPGTYELTETTSAGCSSSASVITIAPQPLTPPAPGFAQVDPTCTVATGSVSVTAPQGTSTYTLTGTSPVVAPQTGTSFTGLAPGTYELTETTSAGCSSSASVITVAPQPLTPPAPGFAQVDPTCTVATGSVSVTAPQGTSTYTLTGTSPVVAPQTGTSFTGLAPGTYELTETTSAGCSSSASVITVAPQPLTPPAPGFAQVDPTCTVATGSVSVTAPQGTSTYTLTGTSPVVAPQTGTSFTGLASGTYELTETTSAGCSSSASVITVAPQPLTPPAPAFAQVDPTCTVATGSVSVTAPQGTSTYTLTGTSPAVAPQTGTSFTGLAPGTYELTETTSAGCSSSASVITVEIENSLDNLTLSCPPTVRLECGDSFDAESIGFPEILTSCGEVNFTFIDTELIGGCSANTGSFIRSYTGTDDFGNTAICEQTIIIEDTTPPLFEDNISDVLFMDCEELPGMVTPIFTDNCDSVVSIDFTEREISNGECALNRTLERTWIAIDDCGNESSFVQTIHFTCPLQIYTAVSSNNDGANDIFMLEGIECYPDNTVKIFNRWGVLVYETDNYDNKNRVFRGISEGRVTITKNKKLPDGDYFYIVIYKITRDNEAESDVIKEAGHLYLNN
nr:gliding motility-associated C-terminal domain-containing protein [uncultured Allomuricauda sp.]